MIEQFMLPLVIIPKRYPPRIVTVHFEHPENPIALNLCGEICTRDEPNTTDESRVNCLNCILHMERGTAAEI